ncbi:transcriptional regulator with PAS, ATPase and Fis domain [Desulfohalotomaculum tongense]|uniref:sigma-54 interaction domain-containing protein n=1 Tax=Desulforadius tongensis TaxID=1216062 RepID=UPI00195EDF11|nr:sigma 54-interacting transcriptional regulator [Desulforadius tongensis]MBM7854717.1 transcriptional regulator with PAS, ATPase and Fis domain [Desulforadius tongensis]
MEAQHDFNLRVRDITIIPVKKAVNDKRLRILKNSALGVNENDPLLDVLSNEQYNGQPLLVVAANGEAKGLITPEILIKDLCKFYSRLLKYLESKLLEGGRGKASGPCSALNKLVGRSPKIKEVIKVGKKAARTDAPILVRGESGTGKESFARAIHLDSPRKNAPFITINCGAIPANLFESELFGYAAEAFIGAGSKSKPGMFELADGGTIFLDEVGELPLEIQVKLLQLLEHKTFVRVGSTKPTEVDVRVIAATHRDLENMIKNEQFREDLYYRLSVITVDMPPLRERKEDIPELVHLFLQEFSQTYGKVISRVEPEVTGAFLDYSWPGNVRELKNVVERLVVLAENDVINADCLPENLRRHTYISVSTPDGGSLMNVAVEAERQLISKTLEKAKGNRSEAARMLGIPRSTLYYKLRQLGIPAKSQRGKHSKTGGEKKK